MGVQKPSKLKLRRLLMAPKGQSHKVGEVIHKESSVKTFYKSRNIEI